jgi:hypothetical protein
VSLKREPIKTDNAENYAKRNLHNFLPAHLQGFHWVRWLRTAKNVTHRGRKFWQTLARASIELYTQRVRST